MNPNTVPYSPEAEEAVIGSVLLSGGELYPTLQAMLKPSDFFLVRHGVIWKAIERLVERKDPVDLLTVNEELSGMGRDGDIGGIPYLTALMTGVGTSYHAGAYATIVKSAAMRRAGLLAADKVRQLFLDEERTFDDIRLEVQRVILQATHIALHRRETDWRDVVNEELDRVDMLRMRDEKLIGLPSGFKDIDKMMQGLQKGHLLILGGRPGMGKTALMLTLMIQIAKWITETLGRKPRIGLFTMEMSASELVQRMAAQVSGINMQKIRLGKLTDQEHADFVTAMSTLDKYDFLIDETSAASIEHIRSKCYEWESTGGVDIVFVDFLTLMSRIGFKGESAEFQAASHNARELKNVARDFQVPVMCAAQLSRKLESRQDKRPQLSDLRESGVIEEAADSVWFLYRDSVYNDATENPNAAEVIIAKWRHGPTGTVPLYFNKSLTRFENAEIQRIDLSSL